MRKLLDNFVTKYRNAAHDDCIKELPTSGHTRMRDNLASLMSGIWLLLQFGVRLGTRALLHRVANPVFLGEVCVGGQNERAADNS